MDSWFDEFTRKFDELAARSERRWAALEQRGAAAVKTYTRGLEQTGGTLLVEADNWGGIFDEIPALDTASSDSSSPPLPAKEQHAVDARIEADNWGGEFGEPSFMEERDFKPAASVAASTPQVAEQLVVNAAATEEIESEAYPLQIQELERPSARTAASKFVSATFPAAVDRSIDLAAIPRVFLTFPKLIASDCVRDSTAVDRFAPRRRRPLRRLVWRPAWRFASSSRRPPRCLVWRPAWRLASCGRRPRGQGHRIRARPSLEPRGMGFRDVCHSMAGRSSNFARNAFGLRTCAMSGPSIYEEDVQGKANSGFSLASLEIPLQHRGVPAPSLLLPPPRDAGTTPPIPTPPPEASLLVLAAAGSKSGAHSVHAARVFDEMWSSNSSTAESLRASRLAWLASFRLQDDLCLISDQKDLAVREESRYFITFFATDLIDVEIEVLGCVTCVPPDENELEVRMQQAWPPLALLPLWPSPWPLFGHCKMMQLQDACPALASNSTGLAEMCGTVIVSSWINNKSSQSIVSGFKMGAIVLNSDSHHVQIHTVSFSPDHDSAAMHAISDFSRGFIDAEGSIQDGIAHCIGGLLSVVVKKIQLGIDCHGVLLTSIKFDGYTSQVAGNRHGGSVSIGDLYADEERRFLVILCFDLLAEQYWPPWAPPNQLTLVQLLIKHTNGWFACVFQLSGKAKENFLQHGDCFSACRDERGTFVLFLILLGGQPKLLVAGDNCFLIPVNVNHYQLGSSCADPILSVLVCDALSYAYHVDQSLDEYDSFNTAQEVRPRLRTTELRVPWDPGGLQLVHPLSQQAPARLLVFAQRQRGGRAVLLPRVGHGIRWRGLHISALRNAAVHVRPAVASVVRVPEAPRRNVGVQCQERGLGGSSAHYQDHDHCSGLRASHNSRRGECQVSSMLCGPASGHGLASGHGPSSLLGRISSSRH